ncbi:MAG: DUF3486 family protein [SAR324 cluster bacterium]|nr:DUF3486 family protein [SAR324 cluster bacterium]
MDALPEITLAVARLTRASVAQKIWQTKFRDRLAAAAEKAGSVARKSGLSAEAAIRREILGVAG